MKESFHGLYKIERNDTELELWSINVSDFIKEFRPVANIALPVCILGLIGNGILCWLLCCTIKKSRFIIYVLNLVISDFIMVFHYFVAYLLFFLRSHTDFYRQHAKAISLVFGADSSIYFLTAISVERYAKVSSPFLSQSRQQKHWTTRHHTAIVCISFWTLSFLLTLIEYFSCHPRYLKSHIIGFLYCHTAIVLQYIINYLIFTPMMVFSTLALLIKMQKKELQNFPTRLDIIIVATVFLHLILSTVIKMTVFINYLIAFVPSSQYRRASLILDCVDSTVTPFVYLLLGFWRKEKGQEPLHVLTERCFNDESEQQLENITRPRAGLNVSGAPDTN